LQLHKIIFTVRPRPASTDSNRGERISLGLKLRALAGRNCLIIAQNASSVKEKSPLYW